MKSKFNLISFACFILIGFSSCSSGPKNDRELLADKMEQHLRNEILDKWYPQSVDKEYGGFLSDFTYDFKPVGRQDKMIVTQARQTWTNARCSELYPDIDQYGQNAAHGFHFLRDVMWDKKNGGFYSIVDRQGHYKDEATMGMPGKNAYGNAFGIYGLAGYYRASGDTAALNFAKKAFRWFDAHCHDPAYGGYFNYVTESGNILYPSPGDSPYTLLGTKDFNSGIHILEMLTELYAVWPDTLVHSRLDEMLHFIRDTLVGDKGYLTLYVRPDNTPLSLKDSSREVYLANYGLDHITFGHDVETAYLIIEAAAALGMEHDPVTHRVAKQLVDHALNKGWDNPAGGFYDAAYYFKGAPDIEIIRDTKNWWAQAEGMNALLLMADLYPDDPLNYYEKFQKQWEYIDRYLIDHEHGDWFSGGLDKEPDQKTRPKGNIWKAIYHHFRALTNCIAHLRNPGQAE